VRPIDITIGQRIAQLIFKPFYCPTLELAHHLSPTVQNDGAFGSTDIVSSVDPTRIRHSDVATTDLHSSMPALPKMPYNIYLSNDPFDGIYQIQIRDFGSHATMGMILKQCGVRNLPQLTDIIPSQPAS
jgi:hypothetical protein